MLPSKVVRTRQSCCRFRLTASVNDESDSTEGEMKVYGVQGTVMESIGRTWVRKGFLGFFSGNSAGSLACLGCIHAAQSGL